jgi:hypothetical protein
MSGNAFLAHLAKGKVSFCCLWRPCLLMDRDKMSSLYKGPSIDASYQVSVHLAKRFQSRFFLIDQSETRIAYGGHVCRPLTFYILIFSETARPN